MSDSLLRRLLPWLAIPLLLWLMAQAVISTRSYVIEYRANIAVDSWQNGTRRNLEMWQSVERGTQDALIWDKKNSTLLNTLGRLYDYRASYLSDSATQTASMQQQAIEWYREAIRFSPVGAYPYMNLAVVKVRSGAIDAEFKAVLLRLVELVPREKSSVPMITKIAALTWPQLDNDTRTPLRHYLLQIALEQPHIVKDALLEVDRLQQFCKSIARNQQVAICEK